MTKLSDQKQSRREFIRGIARYSALGIFAVTTGVLIKRRRSASVYEEAVNIRICQSCSFLRKCDQPSAVLARRETQDARL
jgi:hypothetical protein